MDKESKINNDRLFKSTTPQEMEGQRTIDPMPSYTPQPMGNFTSNNMGKQFYSTTPMEEEIAKNPFMGNQKADHGMAVSTKKVYWGKHREKEIEYYCKLCHSIVCPKWMFLDHNGHELAQLEDVSSIIKQNIHDLNKLLMNTKRITEDKRNYIVYLKKEIDRLKDVQLKNIDQGFAALIKRMEDKRDSLKEEFQAKYVSEGMSMYNKITLLDKYANDISNIEIVYEELYKFVNKNIDAKVCSKINDISSFISKSIEDLEKIAKSRGFDKAEAFIKPDLKPLTLNVDKAYEIIGKFNLISSKPSKKVHQSNLHPPSQSQQTQSKYTQPQPSQSHNRMEPQTMERSSNPRFEEYQPSPMVSQNNRDFLPKNRVSNSTNNGERLRSEYEEIDKVSSIKNPNFSTKGRGGNFDSQVQIMPEEYTYYERPFDGYNQAQEYTETNDEQNIALKSIPNELEGKYSKSSFNQNEYDDVESDIRNVEQIQKELHQMDISDKQNE